MHLLPAYCHLGYGEGNFPVSEPIAGRILSLPLFPHMSIEQVTGVIAGIRAFFSEGVSS